MRYLLLPANDPDAWAPPPPADPPSDADAAVFDDWVAYTRALQAAGVLVDAAALHSPDAATSVRVRDGRVLLVDGPFAETKEHLISYFVVDVPDLDTALAWAARVPNVRTGTVEVRPVQPGTEAAAAFAGDA